MTDTAVEQKTSTLMSIEDIQVLETVRAFLHREARLLDDRDLASSILRTARELYVALGAKTYVTRCDRELKAAGVDTEAGVLTQGLGADGPGSTQSQDTVQLTAQEQAVAQFVARGATNK